MKQHKLFFLLFFISLSIFAYTQKQIPLNIPLGHNYEVKDISINNKKTQIASIDKQKIVLWDLKSKHIIKSIKLNHESTYYDKLSILFSKDDKKLIVSSNHEIFIYNIEFGELKRSIVADTFLNIKNISYSPDRSLIVSSFKKSYNDTIKNNFFKIWDINSGNLVKEYIGSSHEVISANFNSDGRKIITLEYDNKKYDYFMVIYDWENDKTLYEHKTTYQSTDCFLINNDSEFITVSNNELSAFNVTTGEELRTFKRTDKGYQDISSYALNSEKNKIIVSFGWDKIIYEFDLNTGGKLNYFNAEEKVDCIYYYDNDHALIPNYLTIQLLNIKKQKVINNFKSEINRIKEFSLSKDGGKFLQCNLDGSLECWDVNSGKQINSIIIPNTKVKQAIFNKKGNKIATACSDGFIRIFKYNSNNEIAKVKLDKNVFHVDYIEDDKSLVAFSKKNIYLITKQEKNYKIKKTISPVNDFIIKNIQLSPVKNIVILACHSITDEKKKKTIIYDLSDNRKIPFFYKNDEQWIDVTFSSDGSFISSNECCTPYIYDLEKEREIKIKDQWESGSAFESFGGDFSSDNSVFAITGDGLVLTSLKDTNRSLKEINVGAFSNKVKFIDDNTKLIVGVGRWGGYGDNILAIYDLEKEKVIQEISKVNSFIVCPDERSALCFNESLKKVFLLDIITGKVKFTRYSFGSNQWFLTNKKNELKGHKSALKKLELYN